MAPSVHYTYFGVMGKGETIRLVLTAGKVKYDETTVTFADWAHMKPTTIFGQLPMLTWDGLEMAQSGTIVRYCARKVGLAGCTEEEFALADMIYEHTADFIKEIAPIRFAPDTATKQTKAEAFIQKYVPNWLASAEKVLKARGGEWFSGRQLTYGDLAMLTPLHFLGWKEEKAFVDVTGCEARFTMLDNYPLLKAHYEKVKNLPEIKEYWESRPASNPPGL